MILSQKTIVIFFIVCQLSISCKSNSSNQISEDSSQIHFAITSEKDKPVGQSSNDDTLYALVGKISEVKNLIASTNKTSPDKKVSIMIAQRPDVKFVYYWMQVGIDDKTRFQPVYNFYINPKTYNVTFYDTAKDSVITIDKWRKTRNW